MHELVEKYSHSYHFPDQLKQVFLLILTLPILLILTHFIPQWVFLLSLSRKITSHANRSSNWIEICYLNMWWLDWKRYWHVLLWKQSVINWMFSNWNKDRYYYDEECVSLLKSQICWLCWLEENWISFKMFIFSSAVSLSTVAGAGVATENVILIYSGWYSDTGCIFSLACFTALDF